MLLDEPDLNLKPFIPFGEENWGFGGVIKTLGEKDGRLILRVNLSHPKETQRETLYDISASLKVLFSALYYSEIDRDDERFQPALISYMVLRKNHKSGCSLTVEVSKDLAEWLENSTEEQIKRVGSMMLDAYAVLTCADNPDEIKSARYQARATLHGDGQIGFDFAPESGLDPESSRYEGYKLESHNVSNPIIQLTFLAGIATLFDLYSFDQIFKES